MIVRLVSLCLLAFALCACTSRVPLPAPIAAAFPTAAAMLMPAPPAPSPTPTASPSPTEVSSPPLEQAVAAFPSPVPDTITLPLTQIPCDAWDTLIIIASATRDLDSEYGLAVAIYSELLSRNLTTMTGNYVNGTVCTHTWDFPIAKVDAEWFQGMLHGLRATAYHQMGKFEAAVLDYLALVDMGLLDPEDSIGSTEPLGNLCWDLAITGQVENALPYCETAITLAQRRNFRNSPEQMYTFFDGRGVVYAQLGMLEEAMADFQAVVDDLANSDDPTHTATVAERHLWIAALEQGVNPITPEVLAHLRREDVAITPTPTPVPGSTAIARSAVQEVTTLLSSAQSASGQGFVFGEPVSVQGEETTTGIWQEGPCQTVIKLTGPETGLVSASLQVSGCSDAEQLSRFYSFSTSILGNAAGETQMAKLLVYSFVDVYYVIAGDIETTGEREIGPAFFEAWSSDGPTPVFNGTARIK